MKKILLILLILIFVSFILTKKSLITPINNQSESVPHIIANIDDPSIAYNVNDDITAVRVSREIIFNKFLGLPFPQFRKGAIAINKIIGVIIGANVAL